MAKYSDVDICNIALHSIGSEAIKSLGEDKKAARACKSFYGYTRDYLLAAFDWNFARKYAVLVEAPGDYSDKFVVDIQPFVNLTTHVYTFSNPRLNTDGAVYEVLGTYLDTTPDIVWGPDDYMITPDPVDKTKFTIVIDPGAFTVLALPPDNLQINAISEIDSALYLPEGVCRYQVPEDCQVIRSVGPLKQRERWELMGDKIWTSRPDFTEITYTREETNPFLFATAFTNLLALGIAVRLAPIMAQDETLAGALYEQFVLDQREAYAIDANEGNDYRALDETPENDTFVNPDIARSAFFGKTTQTNF